MTRAPRWRQATFLALAAVVGAATTLVLTGVLHLPAQTPALSGARTSTAAGAPATTPGPDPDQVRTQALQSLLERRASAVAHRRKSDWMATVADPGSAFGKRQSAVFDNLMRLPLARFTFADPQNQPLLSPTDLGAGAQAWVAKVQGQWSLKGYDRGPRTYDVYLTVARVGGDWRLADDRDGGTQLQAWDLPGMRALTGHSSLVIGNAPLSRMQAYRTQADGGVSRVNAVWGTAWSRRVVLVTPATTAEFASLLSREKTGLEQVAAVTEGPITAGETARADRVVVNPGAYSRLASLGRRVVITHELTHVAIRSTTRRQVPIWLSEGMADHVGYSGLDLPRQRVAAELLTRVRKGKGPTRLPTATDFDPTRSTIAPAYSAAWLACERIADTYGEHKLVAFYRAAAAGGASGRTPVGDPDTATAQAFSSVLGVSQKRFTTTWLAYLRDLAGA